MITVNDGNYLKNQYIKNHPIKYAIGLCLIKTPLINRIFSNPALSSKKSESEWLDEEPANSKNVSLPFEIYKGQESVIFNIMNQNLPHPSINQLVAEEISRNKFLQYIILEDSEAAKDIIDSSLVGLGATDEDKLEEMISKYDNFVVKPILGSCGRGVRFLNKNEISDKYKFSRGPMYEISIFDAFFENSKDRYIEDLVEKGNFSFEWGLSIIQPFVESRYEDKYSIIRAIVCNGKFVDAYERISYDPKVNLSQDAKAIAFDYDDIFAGFCEKIVEIFEDRSNQYSIENHKQKLYDIYFNKRGRTSDLQRKNDSLNKLIEVIKF